MKKIHSPETLAERLGVESTSTSPTIESNSSDIGRELFGFLVAVLRYTATTRSPLSNPSSGLFGSQTSTGKRPCVTPEAVTPESPVAPVKKQRISNYTNYSDGLNLFATTTDWTMEEDTTNNVSEAFRTPVNQGTLSLIPNAPRASRGEQQIVIPFPPLGDDLAENNTGFFTP